MQSAIVILNYGLNIYSPIEPEEEEKEEEMELGLSSLIHLTECHSESEIEPVTDSVTVSDFDTVTVSVSESVCEE